MLLSVNTLNESDSGLPQLDIKGHIQQHRNLQATNI